MRMGKKVAGSSSMVALMDAAQRTPYSFDLVRDLSGWTEIRMAVADWSTTLAWALLSNSETSNGVPRALKAWQRSSGSASFMYGARPSPHAVTALQRRPLQIGRAS